MPSGLLPIYLLKTPSVDFSHLCCLRPWPEPWWAMRLNPWSTARGLVCWLSHSSHLEWTASSLLSQLVRTDVFGMRWETFASAFSRLSSASTLTLPLKTQSSTRLTVVLLNVSAGDGLCVVCWTVALTAARARYVAVLWQSTGVQAQFRPCVWSGGRRLWFLSPVILELVWINTRQWTSALDESGDDLPVARTIKKIIRLSWDLEMLWMILIWIAVYRHYW